MPTKMAPALSDAALEEMIVAFSAAEQKRPPALPLVVMEAAAAV
jgi:hypothetical protein